MKVIVIEKLLSANDVGATGAHQAGILVPKSDKAVFSFFPFLDPSVKNPRTCLDMCDEAGNEWTFNYIYYNNKLFGGTRNEYRLTKMTEYFRNFNLKTGDSLIFRRLSERRIAISYRKAKSASSVLRLTNSWRVIDTRS